METLDRVTYAIIMPLLITIGICGNALHLITLRSKALQSIPFLYIRAIAVFDLVALCFCIIFVLTIVSAPFTGAYPIHYIPAFYLAHVQPPLVNLLLTTSIFTALVLTIERYRSASVNSQFYQLRSVQFAQKVKAKSYILACVFLSFVLHVLMAFENVVTCHFDDYTNCTIDKEAKYYFSQEFLQYYDWIREVLCRMIPVVLLAVLNLFLVIKLHDLKRRRKLMTLRQANLNHLERAKSLMNTFAEKRLTTMMIGMTLIYVIGNLPQSVSMVLTTESRKGDFGFQVFRAFSNVLELGNHCINFYIFCLSSQDYLQTFVRNFRRLKNRFVSFVCRRKPRKESIDSAQSALFQSGGERSLFMTDLNDDLVQL